MFTAFVFFYALSGAGKRSFVEDVKHRAQRLLLPWLAWCAVYFAAKVADAMLRGAPLASEFEYWMLVVGPKIHLWFLPFVFVAGLAFTHVIVRVGNDALVNTACLVLFPVVQMACFYLLTEGLLERPFSQWVFVLPACFLGVLLHFARGDWDKQLLICGVTVGTYLVAEATGWNHGAEQLLIASGACVLALIIHLPANGLSKTLAGISLGIYLIHPLLDAMLRRVLPVGPGEVAFAIAVIVASLLAILMMQRLPLFRRMV
ncbi:MAG TPA: acyltransferase family protein [Alphaproteobacteria bacterium]|nr:acyltransferase family protein [Alphaproteobacteria bacterium]